MSGTKDNPFEVGERVRMQPRFVIGSDVVGRVLETEECSEGGMRYRIEFDHGTIGWCEWYFLESFQEQKDDQKNSKVVAQTISASTAGDRS